MEAMAILAILGDESDAATFQRICIAEKLGLKRFWIVATYGHPRLVPMLLAAMDSGGEAMRYFAGRAFSRITGCDIDSAETAEIQDPDGSEPYEVVLPDVELARHQWGAVESNFVDATRVSNGFCTEPASNDVVRQQFDMETRLMLSIRDVFYGRQRPTAELLFLATDYLLANV